MAITLSDIQKSIQSLESRMATKQDLEENRISTKQDLKELESRMATLEENVTKDIQKVRADFAQNIVTKQDLKDLEEKMATKEEVRNYATIVEKAIGELQNIRIEQVGHTQRHDDLEKTVKTLTGKHL